MELEPQRMLLVMVTVASDCCWFSWSCRFSGRDIVHMLFKNSIIRIGGLAEDHNFLQFHSHIGSQDFAWLWLSL